MKKQRIRQILSIFSLFMLLVLPTAIVGYGNFAQLVNKAFTKPFQKEESTFVVTTESSSNIAKGGSFSVKVTTTSPKTIPLKHFAAFVEFDKTKVDIKSIQIQDAKLLKVIGYQNGFLVYPATMVTPTEYNALLPQRCSEDNTCDFSEFSSSAISFTINGILSAELTEQQRPIKISLLGAADTTSVSIWNEKLVLPVLKLGEYVKNSAPMFYSEPQKYVTEGEPFRYTVETSDADSDVITYSLTCPDTAFCTKEQKAPEGVRLEDNQVIWENSKYQERPYQITVYANDGKSVSTQTFTLQVLQKDTAYFTCTFTPAISVKILDYRVETPLVIVAESSEQLARAKIALTKDGKLEKTFDYTFTATPKRVILDKTSNPSLSYQFNKGTYNGQAIFTSTTGKEFICELKNPTVSLGLLIQLAVANMAKSFLSTVNAQVSVATNAVPSFTSDPMSIPADGGSSPSVSFVYGTAYSFTLRAKDIDGDPLQHTIVAKPSWANVAVSSTTTSGGETNYSIQFTGTPAAKHAGSNLFSVSVNDGYGHYITRTWVINVDYPNNDIPRLTITDPTKAITRYQGSPFLLKWTVTDRHQIVSFGVYYTKSLSTSSRSTYNNNISYNTRGITVNTNSLAPGDYYFIVTATDGFSPPAVGTGYTALVRILPKPKPTPKPTITPKPTTSPTVTATKTTTPIPTTTPTITPSPTEEPSPEFDELSIQVTSPKNQDEISPPDFQSVISFSASRDGILSKSLLSIELDGTDITDKYTFSADSGKAITATYKPNTLLEPGVHQLKVTAKDTKDKTKEVTLSFTITENSETDENLVDFFGIYINKKYYTYFIAAMILIIILVLLPIIMYFAFRNSDKDLQNQQPKQPTPVTNPPTLKTPTASFVGVATPPTTTNYPTIGTADSKATVYTPILKPKEPVTPTALPETRPVVSETQKVTSPQAMNTFVQQVRREVTTTPMPISAQTHSQLPAKPDYSPVIAKPTEEKPVIKLPSIPQQVKPASEAFPQKLPMTEQRPTLPATPLKQHESPRPPATVPGNMIVPKSSEPVKLPEQKPPPLPEIKLPVATQASAQSLPPESPSIPKL
ncbi:hypothetical protein IT418_03840 [bacterium]|nr:hypothetical protein [bacterium]